MARPHRGHRLGLRKAAMLDWLASAEPQLEQIETGNADANEHMIAINEELGFTILDPAWAWLDSRLPPCWITQCSITQC